MITLRLLLLLIPPLLAAVETGPLPVHRVVDGDTIEVVADLGGVPMVVPVRILWIDAPESRGSRAMPEGQLATEALTALIGEQPVALYVEGDAFERDRYGRLLASVSVVNAAGGPNKSRTDVAGSLILLGAVVYWQRYGAPSREGDAEQLSRLQDYARQQRAGIWGTAAEWAEARAAERPDD